MFHMCAPPKLNQKSGLMAGSMIGLGGGEVDRLVLRACTKPLDERAAPSSATTSTVTPIFFSSSRMTAAPRSRFGRPFCVSSVNRAGRPCGVLEQAVAVAIRRARSTRAAASRAAGSCGVCGVPASTTSCSPASPARSTGTPAPRNTVSANSLRSTASEIALAQLVALQPRRARVAGEARPASG